MQRWREQANGLLAVCCCYCCCCCCCCCCYCHFSKINAMNEYHPPPLFVWGFGIKSTFNLYKPSLTSFYLWQKKGSSLPPISINLWELLAYANLDTFNPFLLERTWGDRWNIFLVSKLLHHRTLFSKKMIILEVKIELDPFLRNFFFFANAYFIRFFCY